MAINGWQQLTIEEIKSHMANSIAIGPFGSRMKSDRYTESGIPVIRGNNISDTRELIAPFVHVSSKTADELKSCVVVSDDLVFPHRGSIGKVGIIPSNDIDRYVMSSSIMKLTCNKNIIDPMFLFYFFRSSKGQHELLKNASTVGTPGIGQPLTSLRSIIIPVPPLPEQRAITHILSTLDDKIKLNRIMNKTLESISKVIFKHWFIDFEFPNKKEKPYRSSGGVMVYHEESSKEIPQDWNVEKLGNLITFVKGKKPKNTSQIYIKNYEPQILIETLNNREFVFADPKNMVHVSKLDCIMVMDGASSGRVEMGHEGILGSTLAKIIPSNDSVSNFFIFHFLKLHEYDINANTTGSSIPHADKQRIRNYLIMLPDENILQKFNVQIGKIVDKIIVNKNNISTLSQIRNSIINKLMSGKIRVPAEVN